MPPGSMCSTEDVGVMRCELAASATSRGCKKFWVVRKLPVESIKAYHDHAYLVLGIFIIGNERAGSSEMKWPRSALVFIFIKKKWTGKKRIELPGGGGRRGVAVVSCEEAELVVVYKDRKSCVGFLPAIANWNCCCQKWNERTISYNSRWYLGKQEQALEAPLTEDK